MGDITIKTLTGLKVSGVMLNFEKKIAYSQEKIVKVEYNDDEDIWKEIKSIDILLPLIENGMW